VSLAGAALVMGQWAGGTANALDRGMQAADTIWYHLPFAARFAQDDSLADLHYIEIEPLTAYFPLNAELLHAIGMAAFDRDVASPFVNLGFVALALLAGWCIGRPWGVAPLSMLATSVALSVPVLWGINAGQAGNDIVGVALFLSAAALLANARGRGAGMAWAALAAGLTVGTKLSMLAPIAALTIAAIVLAPAGRRLRGTAVWAAGLVAAGGFWFARNIVHTGSPLPWLDLKLGPLSWQAPPRRLTEDYEFPVLHYLTDTAIWSSHFRPGLDFAFGGIWFVVLALAGAGAIGAVVVRGDRVRQALGAVAVLCTLAYLVTPNSAAGREGDPFAFGLNSRYAVTGMALALALLPTWAALRGGRARIVLAAVLGVTLAATMYADTGLRAYERGSDALLIAVLLAAAVLAAWWAVPRVPARAAVVAGVALTVLLVAGGGYAVSRAYLDERYRTERASAAGAWFRDLRDARIAVLGASAHYPFYGTDLSNRVVFIGQTGDHGAFTRLRSCREWIAALDRGRFDYVFASPVSSPNLPAETPKDPPPERGWTAAEPAAREVYRDQISAAYRIDGRLTGERCPG
jgi:hypothetical protein